MAWTKIIGDIDVDLSFFRQVAARNHFLCSPRHFILNGQRSERLHLSYYFSVYFHLRNPPWRVRGGQILVFVQLSVK